MQAGPDYAEGLINKMRTVIRRNPHQGDAAHNTSQSASSGQRLKPSGHYSPPSSTVSSFVADRRPFFIVIALLAALAVSLLFLLPGGLLQAQDANGPIEYEENRTDAVATFTAVDPEEKDIDWDLMGDDAGDFTIEGGVLAFMSPPDFEDPSGGIANDSNTYSVTVQASAGASTDTAIQTAGHEVTVTVTNVEEPGAVMLSTLQPQVGVAMTATLTDDDIPMTDTVMWQWYRGTQEIPGATTATYSPSDGDIGDRLRAKVIYKDGEDEDEDKSAEEASAHTVRAAPASNITPVFPDEDLVTDDNQILPRKVAENTASGRNIGAPVVATDPGDVLTYSFAGANNRDDEALFDIDRATGQLKTKEALNHEADDGSYTVTVTATDPFGAPASGDVTIEITDVNEAPTITETDLESTLSFEENAVVTTELAAYAATDQDTTPEDTLTWSKTGADAGKFELSADRELTFMSSPNFESPGDADRDNDYEVTVVVSDGKGNSDEHDVSISVTNAEEAGTVTFSTLQPRVGVELTAMLDEPDGSITDLMWQWSSSETNNEEAFEEAVSASYTPVADDIGDTLTATATYKDGFGTEEKTAAATRANVVIADTRNKAPTFPDQDMETEGEQTDQERDVDENTAAAAVIGAVVGATDANPGDLLTYTLGGADAASFDIVASSGQLQTKAALDHEAKDSYTIRVTATDSLGETATVMVTIMVNDVDEVPELEGESSAEYAENGTGPVLTFTAKDPERKDIDWGLTGSDAGVFSIDGGVLKFLSPPDFEGTRGNNTYTVTVEASAGVSETANIKTVTREVTVTVTNVEEPGAVMLSTLQPQVGVAVTATLTDDDNVTQNTVMWQWFRGSTEITGAAAKTATYPPAPGDVGNHLRAKATYTDGEDEDKSAQADSSRTVRRAPSSNANPQFPSTDIEREIAENTPAGRNVGARVVASDTGDVLTYSFQGTTNSDDEDSFDIDRATGQLKTKVDLDHETEDSYTVTVTATDPFGESANASVAIAVTDVNEAPTIIGSPAPTLPFAENAEVTAALVDYAAEDLDTDPTDTLTWSLRGADAGKFELTSDGGVLTFMSSPDYESPGDADGDNDYELTVVVSDGKGNSDEHEVTISVTDVLEAGTVTFSTLQPRVGVELTAELDDGDGSITELMWQWSISNTDIDDATSRTYTPVGDDIGDTLTVTATYKDGESGTAERTATADTANMVIADTRNKPPKFPDQDTETDGDQTDQEREVEENTDAGESIGDEDPVVATDKQFATATSVTAGDDTLTYTLGGADAASFDIDATDGQLETKADLDHEAKDTYMVIVTATDPSGLSASVNVTINVTDMDEAPVIMLGGLAISGTSAPSYAEDRSDAVATYTAAGPDSASATWTLSGADAGAFDITGGELTFKRQPDHENPADADRDNVYEVTVEAGDSEGNTASRDVIVTVTDVEDDVVDPEQTLVERYDADSSETIDKSEVLKAINDYLFGEGDEAITKPDVLALINLYLFG